MTEREFVREKKIMSPTLKGLEYNVDFQVSVHLWINYNKSQNVILKKQTNMKDTKEVRA